MRALTVMDYVMYFLFGAFAALYVASLRRPDGDDADPGPAHARCGPLVAAAAAGVVLVWARYCAVHLGRLSAMRTLVKTLEAPAAEVVVG